MGLRHAQQPTPSRRRLQGPMDEGHYPNMAGPACGCNPAAVTMTGFARTGEVPKKVHMIAGQAGAHGLSALVAPAQAASVFTTPAA